MRYDDRLLTVLSQPASDRHDAAVRWRQLVDLIARAGPNSASPSVARALDEIRSAGPDVDEDLRAATARAVAALPLPLGLLEVFASDRLAVSAPVLAAATLDQGQWQALLAVADAETARFIETLHPEVRAEAIAAKTSQDLEPLDLTEPYVEAAQPAAPASPSLHELVERIERRQRDRRASRDSPARAVPANAPALFRWECGPSGEIGWVEGAARGPLIGRSIARGEESGGNRVDAEVVRAFSNRAPFRDAVLTVAGDGPVAGEWRISGLPAFEPSDGRFAGYRGIALRDTQAPVAQPASSHAADILPDPNSLRELVHEIKTPLNAIIGFAEIIDGQYLGPAHHRYRERAAEIVAQARLLLTAIDDLDFAAKAHSTAGAEAPRTNLCQLVERMAPTLRELAALKGVEIEASRTAGAIPAVIEPEIADRLIFRMANAMVERAGEGERLRLSVDSARSHCQVSLSRPVALQGQSDEQLLGSRRELAGGEFSLRLVRGLARIAGADLVTTPAAVSLVFKRA
ncbi:MAG: histidine kinase dimerization/phospho-acceptor domain-containing protein [Pseudomonadota bacterium]